MKQEPRETLDPVEQLAVLGKGRAVLRKELVVLALKPQGGGKQKQASPEMKTGGRRP